MSLGAPGALAPVALGLSVAIPTLFAATCPRPETFQCYPLLSAPSQAVVLLRLSIQAGSWGQEASLSSFLFETPDLLGRGFSGCQASQPQVGTHLISPRPPFQAWGICRALLTLF